MTGCLTLLLTDCYENEMSYFRWPSNLIPQNCHNCGAPGALNAHYDVPPPALVCDGCLDQYRFVCDFCAGAVAWEYPCKNFALPQYNYRCVDNWLVCERCAHLITSDNYAELEALAIERMINKGILALDFLSQGRTFVRALHGGFKKNRTGEPWRIDEQGNRAVFLI